MEEKIVLLVLHFVACMLKSYMENFESIGQLGLWSPVWCRVDHLRKYSSANLSDSSNFTNAKTSVSTRSFKHLMPKESFLFLLFRRFRLENLFNARVYTYLYVYFICYYVYMNFSCAIDKTYFFPSHSLYVIHILSDYISFHISPFSNEAILH